MKKGGASLWTNDLVGEEITVDRFTLEDLITHSKVTYEIIQGYYFDEGRNDRVNTVTRTMFNDRPVYKKAGNPLQLIIKLMMNASHGICGLKPIEVDMRYTNERDSGNFIQNDFNRIKSFNYMPNDDMRFEMYKEIDTYFNRQHVACEILSVSKNIMNEVMCLVDDSGCAIQYTDTDSMHIDSKDVQKLSDAFRIKYGRELDGKGLGQFHCDFDFSGSYSISDGKPIAGSPHEIGAFDSMEAIFLGKKSYIDKLVDSTGQHAYHIRLEADKPCY